MPRVIPPWARRVLEVRADNPDFPVTPRDVVAEWARMRSDPRPVRRPVVVLAGYHSWRLMARSVATTMADLTGSPPERFMALADLWGCSIPRYCRRLVRAVQARWPTDSPDRTAEVDVIGISMGGLVARLAAAEPHEGRRLRIARLFTLGSPHRGAVLAERVAPDPAARCMRGGSEFLSRLDLDLPEAGYELVPYARLRDGFVGATRTAPPGMEPYWVSGLRSRYLGHITVSEDDRLLTDIARRLRGEEPLALRPSHPPSD